MFAAAIATKLERGKLGVRPMRLELDLA